MPKFAAILDRMSIEKFLQVFDASPRKAKEVYLGRHKLRASRSSHAFRPVGGDIEARATRLFEILRAGDDEEAAQEILARYHLRPAIGGQGHFPPVSSTFTVESLGGWPVAYAELIESMWASNIEPQLDLEPASGQLGVEE